MTEVHLTMFLVFGAEWAFSYREELKSQAIDRWDLVEMPLPEACQCMGTYFCPDPSCPQTDYSRRTIKELTEMVIERKQTDQGCGRPHFLER